MPLIVPNIESEYLPSEDETEDLINEILVEGGAITNFNSPTAFSKGEKGEFKHVLNKSGASIENAAKTIANVMLDGKYDHNKLKAAEIILDLHGIRDKEGNTVKQPIFQFFIRSDGAQKVNIDNVFMPNRDKIIDVECEEELPSA